MPPAGPGSGLAGDAGDGDPAGRQTGREPAHSAQDAGRLVQDLPVSSTLPCASDRGVGWGCRCAADFCRAGDVPRPAVPAAKAVQRVVAHTHGPTGTAWRNRADSRLIHSRRTPQSRAGPANSGYSPTETVRNRAQQPQHDGRSAAVRAGSSAGIVSNGSPGSHTGRVRPSSPRSNPFHGLDGIEDTRTRHDAPSPGPSAPRGHATAPRYRARHPAMAEGGPSSLW
jgi:hypothetical protein